MTLHRWSDLHLSGAGFTNIALRGLTIHLTFSCPSSIGCDEPAGRFQGIHHVNPWKSEVVRPSLKEGTRLILA